MRSTMMNVPLLVPSILRHAALYHGDTEIVSRTVEGPMHRTTYADTHSGVGLRCHEYTNGRTFEPWQVQSN